MKHSIRTRFTLGMIFLFLIILILSVFSGYYLNKLSNKTSAILKENYLSVVYAREMSEGVMNTCQFLTSSFLMGVQPDSIKIINELGLVDKSLESEKNNVTEPGEGILVEDIESEYKEFRCNVKSTFNSKQTTDFILHLQLKSDEIYEKLVLLSQMNGNAMEVKTDDAKKASKTALTQMTILGTLCFLIALSFTYSFSSYFNQRFFQLYNGIKQIVSSNYDQRLFFSGGDEFTEISLLFNEMAEKLSKNSPKMSVTLHDEPRKITIPQDVLELKKILQSLKVMEDKAESLLKRIEKSSENGI